jgi:hypothetical protein
MQVRAIRYVPPILNAEQEKKNRQTIGKNHAKGETWLASPHHLTTRSIQIGKLNEFDLVKFRYTSLQNAVSTYKKNK